MSSTTKLIRFGAIGLSVLYLSAWIATGDNVFLTFPAGVALGVAAVRWDEWMNAIERWSHRRIEGEDTP